MHRVMSRTAAVMALVALAGCAGSSSPSVSGSAMPSSGALTAADRNFITQAASGGWSEIALDRIAQQQASDPVVRDFATIMAAERMRANEDLAALAKARGVAVPVAPDPGRQAAASVLRSLSGPAFDDRYMEQQAADHEMSLVLYRNAANSSRDPDLRRFAQQYAPMIEGQYTTLRAMLAAGT
jgi:putative membrane protein